MLRAFGMNLLVLFSMTVLHEVRAAANNPVRVQVIDPRPQFTAAAFLDKAVLGSSSSKMTDEQKKAVVDRHNQLRSKTDAKYQPCTAADMEAMVWDDKLAAESQAWADSCVGDHAPGAGSKFGENLFMSYPGTSYTTDELAGGVEDWYSEIVDSVWGVDDKRGTCKPGATVGHYWQVIWARSKHVGCGVAACTKSLTISGADQGSGVLMVCRYDPPASLKGAGETNSLPYIIGKPCAACPDHCSNGLCTAPPTRCLDKLGGANTITIGSKKYDSCKNLVKDYSANSNMPWCTQLAQMMKAEDTCELSCGKCTVPAGIGREFCDGWNYPKVQEEDAGAEESGGNTNDVEKTRDTTKRNTQEHEDANEKGSKNDMKAKMRERMKAKMREQMKAKMKAKMQGAGTGSSDDNPSGGFETENHGSGELGGHGDGELEGGWDDWHDGGHTSSGWSSGSDQHQWGGDEQWKAAARQQMVADVASFRPPQEPEREMGPAPTLPPLKMPAWQTAAKLP